MTRLVVIATYSTCGSIQNWSRNSAVYQPRRMRAGGSEDRITHVRGGMTIPEQFLPVLSSFGRAIQPLKQSLRGLANAFQVSLFPPASNGLVAHSDGHRVGERKSVNVRKGVGEIQHEQR